MKLGKYFTLEELSTTGTGLDNTPNRAVSVNLKNLVESILDPVREKLGSPIKVNSGYRSPAVNTKIGGAKNSQHLTGEAADISCSDNAKLFNMISDNFLFDQLIWEGGDDIQPDWIHVSYKSEGNRVDVLKMVKVNGKSTYIKI